MGAFNQDKGVERAPNFAPAPHIKPLDIGSVLSGIGDTIGNVVQETDTNNQQYISDELRRAYEVDNKIFGVDDAATMESPIETSKRMGDTPESMKQSVERLDRLKQAYQQGKIRESNYYSRMSAVMRELRARFPGYDDQIDRTATRLVGENPDHAVRKALMREADQERTSAEKQRQQMERQFMSDEGSAVNAWGRYQRGENPSQIMTDIEEFKGAKARATWEQQKMNLMKGREEETKRYAETSLNQFGSTISNISFNGKLAANGIKDWDSFMGWAAKASSDGFDSKELELLTLAHDQMTTQISGNFDVISRQKKNPGDINEKSYLDLLGAAKVGEMKKALIEDKSAIFDAIKSGNSAELLRRKTDLEIQDMNEQNAFEKVYPSAKLYKNVKKNFGDTGTGLVLQRDLETLQKLTSPNERNMYLNTLKSMGEGGVVTPDKILSQTPAQMPNSKGMPEHILTGWHDRLISGKMSPEEVKNYTDTFFSKDNRQELAMYINKAPTPARAGILKILASPEMVNFMSKQGNKQVFKNYYDFMTSNVPHMVQLEVNNLQGIVEDPNTPVKVRIGPNGLIDVQREMRLPANPMMPGSSGEIKKVPVPLAPDQEKSISLLNNAIGAYRELYKANGHDPDLGTQFFLKTSGIDLAASKSPTMWQSISGAVSDWWNKKTPSNPEGSTKDSIKKATDGKRSELPDPFAEELGYAPIQNTSLKGYDAFGMIQKNMDSNNSISFDGRLQTERSSVLGEELKNQDILDRLYAITEAEVGPYNKKDQIAFMESVVNRAIARGESLYDTLNTSYFPNQTYRRAAGYIGSEELRKKYQDVYDNVMSGSNISKYATGNASGNVRFGGGPTTYSNTEIFGLENHPKDNAWYKKYQSLGEDSVPKTEDVNSWVGDRSLAKSVRNSLTNAQGLVSFPISIRSGYRDPETNSKVGGAPHSEHMDGNAVDIDLRGLSNAQRTELVQALVKAGFNRLGAYSGNTGLHVDMKDQRNEDGSPWAMFDRTAANMHKAPKWFKDGLNKGWMEANNGL